MELRNRGRKRRLLVVAVAIAIRDSCCADVPVSASSSLAFSSNDAGWTHSADSSSGSAALTPPSSTRVAADSDPSASSSPTHTEDSSTTPPPRITPLPVPASSSSTEILIIDGTPTPKPHDGSGESSAGFDAKGSAAAGDGSDVEDDDGSHGSPEEAPAISKPTTPTPTPSIGDDDAADGGLERVTAAPSWDDSPSPPPSSRVDTSPSSPTPVTPYNSDDKDETPTPTPISIEEDDATESPPPPRNVLGTAPSPTSRSRPSHSSSHTTSAPPTIDDNNGGTSGSEGADRATRSTSSSPAQEDRAAGSSLTPTTESSPPPASEPITMKPASIPQPSRRFQRGEDVIMIVQASSASGAPPDTRTVVISPSKSPALVVRGDQTSSSNAASSTSTSTDGSSPDVYAFVQYLSCVAALLSLLWLIVSSLLVATASLSTPSWPLGDPNQWEFGVFVAHIQGLASISHTIATSSMPIFALRFMDAFSWTVFLPFHGSATGVGNSRRLDAVILDGIVAFADRVGVNEANLQSNSMAAFVVVFGVVCVIVAVSSFLLWQTEQTPPSSENADSIERDVAPIRQEIQINHPQKTSKLPVWVAVGLFVLLWQFALYPLTLLGSYEISMELQSADQVRTGPLALAFIVLAFVCVGGLVGSSFKVWKLNSRERMATPRSIAVWGSLFGGLRVQHRLLFLAFTINQLLRGVVIGCVVNATVQLALLLAADVVVLAGAVWLRPFQPATLMKHFVFATFGLRIATTAMAFAFTGSTASSARHRVATVLVIIHTTVLLLWFARHFGMACRQIRLQILSRRASTETTPATGQTPQEAGDHTTPQAAAYASFDQRVLSSERRGPGAPYSSAWDDTLHV